MKNNTKPTVEVCFSPSLYAPHHKPADIVVVVDVLRATSAICTAFEHGVERMIPVATIEEARDYKNKGFIVAAERKGSVVEGFDFGNSPFAYMNQNLQGQTVVLTTTNGTKAIETVRSAETVVIGSLLNLDFLSDWLAKQNKNVLLLASGWQDKFCLEDTICAGAITENLTSTGKFRSEEDSSVAARYLYLSAKDNYFGYLKASSHRRRLRDLNLNEDVKYCLTPNTTNVIPVLDGKYLVNLKQ